MGACGWRSYIWWRLCVSEVISGSAHVWWLSPDHSIKNWPVQPVFSPVVVQPLLARQMILRRRFALIRDQFLGRPTTLPSLDLDTAQLIHSLSFVFIILTAYLFAIVPWPFVCTTEVVGAISSYWERRQGIEQAAEQTELVHDVRGMISSDPKIQFARNGKGIKPMKFLSMLIGYADWASNCYKLRDRGAVIRVVIAPWRTAPSR